MTAAASGAFSRQRHVVWRDLRLWAGLALVIVSTVVGGLVLGRSDDAVQVWRATRDLAPGALPQGEPASVVLAEASAAYIPASIPLTGVVQAPVAAGALIPASSVRAIDAGGRRLVTVAVDGAHAPLGLVPGDRVDVWATPTREESDVLAVPQLVLTAVTVRGVSTDALGVGGELPVALEVDDADAGQLVAAARAGAIDLVAVPFDDPS